MYVILFTTHSQVKFGACCYPEGFVTGSSSTIPLCIATTQSACGNLPVITAWIDSKPCSGSLPMACRQGIKGACCYLVHKGDCGCTDAISERYSTKCTAGVTWKSCLADQKKTPTEGNGYIKAVKFAAGATCAADTCPPVPVAAFGGKACTGCG
jgi:hypothetical protein